jgi:DNA-directed RNA polymerase subunit RPC12/RpoP
VRTIEEMRAEFEKEATRIKDIFEIDLEANMLFDEHGYVSMETTAFFEMFCRGLKLSAMPEPGCEWRAWGGYDDEGTYATSCGTDFTLDDGDGSLEESGYKYCPKCGGKIYYTLKEAKE